MKPEQERVKSVIAESVSLMCRNAITYQKEMRIEAVIGITIDTDDVMLVHINEKFDGKDPATQKALNNDPSCIIGDITQKVFTKLNTTAKETTQTRRSNGTTKGPAKRAPAKRGRKQKLVPISNGQINEKVVAETVTNAKRQEKQLIDINTENLHDGELEKSSYSLDPITIKSEPPDQIIQNGLSDGESRSTKGDATSKSDDDTLAMQKSYTNLQDHSLGSDNPSHYKDKYSPPRKRQMLSENHENGPGYVGGGKGATSTNEEESSRLSSLSPSWPPSAPTTEEASTPTATPIDQKPAAASTWSSPTQQKSRSRRPSNGLQSTAVKRMLSEYLVEPIAQTDCKVCTFRLMWHGSVTESEQVWTQLPYYQEAIDRIITEPAQVALAVSAVTATSTRPKSGSGKLGNLDNTPDKFRTFPGLAYWIVLQNEQDFTETDLYNRIYENCFGARLKSLSDQATASDLQEMCSTLYLVVKDNVDGYVRWKLDTVPSTTEGELNFQPVVKVYARAEQDFNTLLMAREALQKNRFYFSLLKTDV